MHYVSFEDLQYYKLDQKSQATLNIAKRLIERAKNNSKFQRVTLYREDYEHINRLVIKESNGRYGLNTVTFLGYQVIKAGS